MTGTGGGSHSSLLPASRPHCEFPDRDRQTAGEEHRRDHVDGQRADRLALLVVGRADARVEEMFARVGVGPRDGVVVAGTGGPTALP